MEPRHRGFNAPFFRRSVSVHPGIFVLVVWCWCEFLATEVAFLFHSRKKKRVASEKNDDVNFEPFFFWPSLLLSGF